MVTEPYGKQLEKRIAVHVFFQIMRSVSHKIILLYHMGDY